ncbi:hypothetical protein WJX84_002485 [Apatococcus fuscideae]|uniref:J domain-containing protein n=1 Tax=Apatococcus fuscideae TaxID=2026836 RepID=A0AAW1T3K6_9CHLO
MAQEPLKLYEALGVPVKASEVEIRRAYRTRISQVHPDKGGSPEEFSRVQLAYEVLHDKGKREHYDSTGQISRTPEELFAKSFAGGKFQSPAPQADQPIKVSEQITTLQSPAFESHTSGFEAWLRSRGEAGTSVFTAESIAQKFGVVKGSYRATPLPRLKTFQASSHVQNYLHTIQTGGSYGGSTRQLPFVIGHDGIGVVMQIAEGVRTLREGDWVIPAQSHMGTWQSLAVWKESDVLKFPKDIMPLEYGAVCREMCLAYRLLEDANLKPGDCIILNGANSTVGQILVQLCFLLKLRCIALVRAHEDFGRIQEWLKACGASQVLPDVGSIEAHLLKFQAKPKLGLDCIGGSSTTRISNVLHEGGQLVIYGCMCGTAPTWASSTWIFQGIQVKGCNIRKWMQGNNSKFMAVMESLGTLIKASKLQITFTEYDMATELDEAVSHASSPSKNTKILLKFEDIGREY